MKLGSLYKALYAKLTGNGTVSAAFGTRIYSERADMTGTPTYPYMVVWQPSSSPSFQFNGKTLEDCDIQIDVFSSDTSVLTIATLLDGIVAALEDQAISYSATSNDYVNVRMRRSGGPAVTAEDRLLHGIILFELSAQESS